MRIVDWSVQREPAPGAVGSAPDLRDCPARPEAVPMPARSMLDALQR